MSPYHTQLAGPAESLRSHKPDAARNCSLPSERLEEADFLLRVAFQQRSTTLAGVVACLHYNKQPRTDVDRRMKFDLRRGRKFLLPDLRLMMSDCSHARAQQLQPSPEQGQVSQKPVRRMTSFRFLQQVKQKPAFANTMTDHNREILEIMFRAAKLQTRAFP